MIERQALVLGFAIFYWGGVAIQIARLRKRIGRSPNVSPRGLKERLLWAGWTFVVVSWCATPFITGDSALFPLVAPFDSMVRPVSLALGTALLVLGQLGTLLCYRALGDHWRMGVNRGERNPLVSGGPYRHVRHPIYMFQVVILFGVFLLLPSVVSAVVLLVHHICVYFKMRDEEAYLLSVHGEAYREYMKVTGAILPGLRGLSGSNLPPDK